MLLSLSTQRLTRPLGVALGVLLALLCLTAWRVPGGARALGADVRIDALQTGAIGVMPLHPFVRAPSLLPGRSAGGSVTLRNQTGVPLRVRLRALPSTRDLDPLLSVRIESGPLHLYSGTLAGLRTAGTQPLLLGSAQQRTLRVEASLPASARSGYQGRIVDITLAPTSRTAR
jgi:hypothetical protein